MGRNRNKHSRTSEIDGKNNQKKDNLYKNDKSKNENKSEATPSISKNDRKPTFEENSKINKKTNDGEDNNNDLFKARNQNKTHFVTSETDQMIRKSRNKMYDAYSDLNRSRDRKPKNNNHYGESDQKHEKDISNDTKSNQNSGKLNKTAYNNRKTDIHEDQLTIKDANNVLREIDEDLFNLPKEIPLAHCVAEDLRMGAGIAVEFKRYFGGVGKLVDQSLSVGNVGIVKRHDQIAFYLITKKNSGGKPTMSTLSLALCSLLQKMKELKLTELGIPTIGCGLDGLDWDLVKELIIKIFTGSGIHITVCKPSRILDRKQAPLLKVYITPKNIWEMEKQTDIILFINLHQLNKKNRIDDVENRVNSKYPFIENLLNDVKKKKFSPGDMIQYVVHNEKIICVFTSKTEYYSNIENAFVKIKNLSKSYRYFAFQSGPIKPAENFKHISWVVLILRSIINNSELWLCGDTDQSGDIVLYDQYCKNILNNSRYSSNFNSSGQMDYNKINDGDSNHSNRKSQNLSNSTNVLKKNSSL